MTIEFFAVSWTDVLGVLRQHPSKTIVRIPKTQLPHPEERGAVQSMGLPLGQSADFRWKLGDCSGLHVRDFGSHYEAHIDEVDPACDIIEHLRQDSPGSYVTGAAAIGALLGLLVGRNKEAILVGAGLGAVLGAVSLPDADDKDNLV